MTQSSDLKDFVRDALKAGQPPETLRKTLATAEWTKTEIDAALAGWMIHDRTGAVPRPVRSRTAQDALFYALLFAVFGMVAGNALALLYGQINLWIPETGDRSTYSGLTGLRWSMAALIVFVPVFYLLDRADNRASRTDPARRHGTMRRWLSAIAMLIAILTLLGDALFLIYNWLDGQLTGRFLAKSATVALLALIVLAYFREDRDLPFKTLPMPAAWAMITVSVLSLGLSFWTIGGPAQGAMEQRDRWRVADMRSLQNDLVGCSETLGSNLPETLDPTVCARNPGHLTGYAKEITYRRLNAREFELCVPVEFPKALSRYTIVKDGTLACTRGKLR